MANLVVALTVNLLGTEATEHGAKNVLSGGGGIECAVRQLLN